MPAELPVFELALLFALTMYMWETYLDSRQKARLEAKGGVVPPALGALVKTLDAEALKRGKDAPKKAADVNGTSADSSAKKEDDDKKKDDKIEDGKALEKMTADAPKFQVRFICLTMSIYFFSSGHFINTNVQWVPFHAGLQFVENQLRHGESIRAHDSGKWLHADGAVPAALGHGVHFNPAAWLRTQRRQ